MNSLESMIKTVIFHIEEKISQQGSSEKLNMLLSKYQCALRELLEDGNVSTNLVGGCRAYMDSYSDYMNNKLLDSMYVVEKYIKQQAKQESGPLK